MHTHIGKTSPSAKQNKGEMELRSALKTLFPNTKTYYNARKLVGLKKEMGKGKWREEKYWEVDVWMPELKLGFEYQVIFLLVAKVGWLVDWLVGANGPTLIKH